MITPSVVSLYHGRSDGSPAGHTGLGNPLGTAPRFKTLPSEPEAQNRCTGSVRIQPVSLENHGVFNQHSHVIQTFELRNTFGQMGKQAKIRSGLRSRSH